MSWPRDFHKYERPRSPLGRTKPVGGELTSQVVCHTLSRTGTTDWVEQDIHNCHTPCGYSREGKSRMMKGILAQRVYLAVYLFTNNIIFS